MTTPQTYIGLDVSLTRTGIVCLTAGLPSIVRSVESKGRTADSLAIKIDRLDQQARTIVAHVPPGAAVGIEGPALGSNYPGHDAVVGLRWAVLRDLQAAGHLILEVPPSTLKKYATGTGNAAKDTVLAAAVRAYPEVEITNNDEADAAVIAAIVARTIGHPVEASLAKAKTDALGKLELPVGWGA